MHVCLNDAVNSSNYSRESNTRLTVNQSVNAFSSDGAALIISITCIHLCTKSIFDSTFSTYQEEGERGRAWHIKGILKATHMIMVITLLFFYFVLSKETNSRTQL